MRNDSPLIWTMSGDRAGLWSGYWFDSRLQVVSLPAFIETDVMESESHSSLTVQATRWRWRTAARRKTEHLLKRTLVSQQEQVQNVFKRVSISSLFAVYCCHLFSSNMPTLYISAFFFSSSCFITLKRITLLELCSTRWAGKLHKAVVGSSFWFIMCEAPGPQSTRFLQNYASFVNRCGAWSTFRLWKWKRLNSLFGN